VGVPLLSPATPTPYTGLALTQQDFWALLKKHDPVTCFFSQPLLSHNKKIRAVQFTFASDSVSVPDGYRLLLWSHSLARAVTTLGLPLEWAYK
jgi:hypothetical protein